MPGIVGLITRIPREQAVTQLERMVEILLHEPFYRAGTWVEESLGVYVGWVGRLGSFSDEMPLRNEVGDMVLVFSGEEYPEPGTAQRLKVRGHELDAAGPNYLVHLYEEDPTFPAGLNGRFHGLLTDRNSGSAVLFNDRYGMHRIYYHESKDAFYFAAEAKAILAVCTELRRMDPRALGEFVACGCTLEDRSLFEGIHVLPGGSRWVFRNGSLIQKERYFEPQEWEDQDRLEPEPYYREIRDVFSRNLPRFFEGQEPIGMSLTGGLDTRMIMAWRKTTPASLPCYTFGGMLRDCQDVMAARHVARLCQQPHQVIRVGEEFFSRFPHYAERAVYLTDGCADVSRAADLNLNERARDIAPVRMTGNYGGEVLRRVRAFKPVEPLAGLFDPELLSYIHQAGETYSGLLRGHPLSFAVFKQGPWHHYGVMALEQTQLAMRSPYLDNDFVRAVYRAPESALATSEVSLRLIADGNRDLLQIPTDRGLAGERGRFLEAVSYGLLEFLFKAEYAYDIGMPQWAARADHVLSPLRLERLFLGRHKIFHFRIWYREALAEYVREMLLDPLSLSRPYIERRALESVVKGHLKGDRNYTTELHKLLTLEIVHRLFLDDPEIASSGGSKGAVTLRPAHCGRA
jgi:asparagine synthase (glutamine-hydrolysing)